MSRFYDTVVGGLRFVVRRYFREIEVTGLEHLPADGGGILVSWHPNGMIDPGLILTHVPRQVVFGARDGLFRWPGLGWLMRSMGAVPIYRAMDAGRSADPGERRAANMRSLDALAQAVVGGRYSCLFPEGDSHDAPHLLELKTGAARFYYRARQLSPQQRPVIIPVGLHYDAKRAFRSSVLIAIHPPLTIDLDLADPPEEPTSLKARCQQLTGEIERTLREVVHATESWELHHLMHRVRKLSRAERAHRAGARLSKPSVRERTLGFSRVWAGYYARMETHPEEVAALRARIGEYNADLRALGIEDHELDRSPELGTLRLMALLLLQVAAVFLLLPPLILVGLLVNGPPALLLFAMSQRFAKRKKDEATIKLLVGALLLPATWIGVGVLAALAHQQLHTLFPALPDTPALAGLAAALLAALGGVVGLRYVRLARETARAVRVRLTRARRHRTLSRLREERAVLYDAIMSLLGDLQLPGRVDPTGQIRPD